MDSDKETATNRIDAEIEWGLNYRQQKKKARKPSISPTLSPINIQLMWQKYQITKQLQELEQLQHQIVAKPPPKFLKLSANKSYKVDRASFTKKEYINYLATPKRRVEDRASPSPVSLLKKKLQKETCSPRLVQLAKPKKNTVLGTWRNFYTCLSVDFIERLDELLNTDNTLDPKFARCCFKHMDIKKNKEKHKQLKIYKRKVRKEKKNSQKWLKVQVKATADLIIKFLQREPLLTLNFKQMMLSNVILSELVKRREIRFKPVRNSNNPYRQSIIDIVDQLAVWMDTIVRYIDIQCTESIEAFAQSPSLESLLGVQEGEGEGEEEGEEEEEEDEDEEAEEDARGGGYASRTETEERALRKKYKKKLFALPPVSKTKNIDEAESSYDTTFDDLLDDDLETNTILMPQDENMLTILIEILSNSSSEMLERLVDPDALPNVTYQDVLDRLKKLCDREQQKQKKERQHHFEKAMVSWAINNDPKRVNKRLINKIQDTAAILAECLRKDYETDRFAQRMNEMAGEESDVGSLISEELAAFERGEISDRVNGLDTLTEEDANLLTETFGTEGDISEIKSLSSGMRSTTEESGSEKKRTAGETETDKIVPWGAKYRKIRTGMPEEAEEISGFNDTIDDTERDKISLGYKASGASKMSKKSSVSEASRALETSRVSGAPEAPKASGASEAPKTSGASETSEASAVLGAFKIAERIRTAGNELELKEIMGIRHDIPNMIPAHKPSKVFEHLPDTLCCLTLKVWATWLLDVSYNAQSWSQWLTDIVREVRRIALVIRGEVKDAHGNTVMFYKEDWIKFSEKVDKMIVSWRQYSMHVKDLSDKIIKNFRGKKVTCCPKCLQDNLISDVAIAHDISQQLAEAMSTANYWRRWLDSVVMETKRLTKASIDDTKLEATSSYGSVELVEVFEPHSSDSEESMYEIEELK